MTLEEYTKKVTKLFENYIDDVQKISTEHSVEIFTDEAIVELMKLKQKAGLK